jgi:hypothetical protein
MGGQSTSYSRAAAGRLCVIKIELFGRGHDRPQVSETGWQKATSGVMIMIC